MSMSRILNDPEEVRAEFDRVWPWLWESLCEFGPTHSKEQVWFLIYTGKAYLWPGKTCVVVGQIINWPIGLRDFNYWLQGGNLDELLTFHPVIEAWAKEQGCQRAIGNGRPGWVRTMHGEWQKGATTRTKWLIEPPSQIQKAGSNDAVRMGSTSG